MYESLGMIFLLVYRKLLGVRRTSSAGQYLGGRSWVWRLCDRVRGAVYKQRGKCSEPRVTDRLLIRFPDCSRATVRINREGMGSNDGGSASHRPDEEFDTNEATGETAELLTLYLAPSDPRDEMLETCGPGMFLCNLCSLDSCQYCGNCVKLQYFA